MVIVKVPLVSNKVTDQLADLIKLTHLMLFTWAGPPFEPLGSAG